MYALICGALHRVARKDFKLLPYSPFKHLLLAHIDDSSETDKRLLHYLRDNNLNFWSRALLRSFVGVQH